MNPTNTKDEREKRRKPSLLDEVLERRVWMYAVAAGATLAATSACAPSAQAKVVFTPSRAVLTCSPNTNTLQIDLNNDGVTDFILSDWSFSIFHSGTARRRPRRLLGTSTAVYYNLTARGAKSSNVILKHGSSGFPAALTEGAKIGSSATFLTYGALELRDKHNYSSGYAGNFYNVTGRFLGVRFVIKGEVHYGWIGFRSVKNFTAKLYGWAYETKPNTPIYAGFAGALGASALLPSAEPTSLELLARGYDSVADWRRRRAA
jgi:hypothetical protein